MSINNLLNVEEPEPQKTFDDRVARANYFVDTYHPPYEIYIDGWSNDFAELFRAWPDKYHCINKNLEVVAKSEYHMSDMGDNKEAVIVEDYTIVLDKLMNK